MAVATARPARCAAESPPPASQPESAAMRTGGASAAVPTRVLYVLLGNPFAGERCGCCPSASSKPALVPTFALVPTLSLALTLAPPPPPPPSPLPTLPLALTFAPVLAFTSSVTTSSSTLLRCSYSRGSSPRGAVPERRTLQVWPLLQRPTPKEELRPPKTPQAKPSPPHFIPLQFHLEALAPLPCDRIHTRLQPYRSSTSRPSRCCPPRSRGCLCCYRTKRRATRRLATGAASPPTATTRRSLRSMAISTCPRRPRPLSPHCTPSSDPEPGHEQPPPPLATLPTIEL